MKKITAFILGLSSFLFFTLSNVDNLTMASEKTDGAIVLNVFPYDKKVEWKTSKTLYLTISNDIKYEGTLNVSDEFEIPDLSGKKQFFKKARISGVFLDSKNNSSILNNSLEVTFKYDKNKAYIDNPGLNIKKSFYSTNESAFKLSSKEEIFRSPSQCILSQQSNIYQKENWYNLRKTWDYYDNFHIDLICTPNGDIDFNLKSFPNLSSGNSILTNKSLKCTSLENDITRQEIISDHVLNNNNGNDKYNYLTRKIQLIYINKEGKGIANITLESNFRYNKESKESECLSTNHKEKTVYETDNINVSSRTGNRTRSEGGSYSNIEFEHIKENSNVCNNSCDFNSFVKTICDHNGNLITEITD